MSLCEEHVLRTKNPKCSNLNQTLLLFDPKCSSHHSLQLSCYNFLHLMLENGRNLDRESLGLTLMEEGERKGRESVCNVFSDIREVISSI